MEEKCSYHYEPSLERLGRHSDVSRVSDVDVVEIDDDYYDIFDQDTGECLNDGSPFVFFPTKEQVAEWITTDKIAVVQE